MDGRKYKYFYGQYMDQKDHLGGKMGQIGERIMEIPYVMEVVRSQNFKNILEVGNVMSHYFNFNHDVLDKYEVNGGVFNEDIVDFFPEKRYGLIISISTIEHVGFDEPTKEEGKAYRALARIRELLDKGGMAVITVPLGYNPEIDEIVRKSSLPFTRKIYMKRTSILNRWKQLNNIRQC